MKQSKILRSSFFTLHFLYSLQCFRQFGILAAERDADVACTVRAEDEAGSDEDTGLVQ